MAHPYVFQENFERGTLGRFDSETDSAAQLDFAHYKELARYPWAGCCPYSGAFAVRIQLLGGTADAVLSEADTDIALAATNYLRFPVWFSPSFTGTADDTFALLELSGAAAAVTMAIGARIVAATGAINIGAGSAASAAAPSTFAAQDIERGKWYTIEIAAAPAGAAAGTMNIYITKDGEAQATNPQIAITGATNIAITDAKYGIQDHLATTTGVILLGEIIQDDGRLYAAQRYIQEPIFTQSGHAFIGPGYIAGAALLTNEALNQMVLYDTDIADTTGPQKLFFDVDNQTSYGGPLFFQNGCYVELSGTDPRGQVIFVRSDPAPGVFGPTHYSDSGVIQWARGSR